MAHDGEIEMDGKLVVEVKLFFLWYKRRWNLVASRQQIDAEINWLCQAFMAYGMYNILFT